MNKRIPTLTPLVPRTLYINAENGMNLRILHEALKQLDPLKDMPSCAEVVLGRPEVQMDEKGNILSFETFEEWPVELQWLLEYVEKRADQLNLLKMRRREETLAMMGIAKHLKRLAVRSIVVGDLPLPPKHRREDVRLALLSRFHGYVSETTGVSATAALFLDCYEARQEKEVRGRLLYAAQVIGDEGAPFTIALMEMEPAGDVAREIVAKERGPREEWTPRPGKETRMNADRKARRHGRDAGTAGNDFFETIVQFETNVDHITGEEAGAALDALSRDERVLDALWLTGIGKKNRPTGLLRVLCHPEDREEVLRLILRHTHTLGVRVQEIRRFVAPRARGLAELSDQSGVEAKLYHVDGIWHARPESDEVVRRAEETGVGAPALRFARVGRDDADPEAKKGAAGRSGKASRKR